MSREAQKGGEWRATIVMQPRKSLLMVPLIMGVAVSVSAVVAWRSRPTISHLDASLDSTRQANPEIGTEIDALMRAYIQGTAARESVAYMGGGWLMTLPNGVEIDRNGLQDLYAAPIIKVGPEAVPHLLKWAMNDNLAIRYIAVYSLEKLTDVRWEASYFDTENAGQKRERAINAWNQWWEDQAR